MKLAHSTKSIKHRPGMHLLTGAFLFVVTASVSAGTLQLGNPTVRDGQFVFPVVLQGSDQGVAALDFRLAYDPTVFNPVGANTGRNAVQAQKQVSSNVSEPGEFVVVLMGFNQNTLAPGEVVEIVMEKIGEPVGGTTQLQIDDPTLATNVGVEVDSRGLGRTLRFSENDTPDPKRDDTEAPESEEDAPTVSESSSESDGNSADNNPIGIGTGPLQVADGSAIQPAMTDTPNPVNTNTTEPAPGRAGQPRTVAERTDSSGPGAPAPSLPESPSRANGGQNRNGESSQSTAIVATNVDPATSTDRTRPPQTTANKSVSPPEDQPETLVVEGGRQTTPKYATLVLLMVGVPLGMVGILRLIKR